MRYAILTFLIVGLLGTAVRGTVLVPVDLSELSREATIITRGEVVAVDGRWTDDRRTIETLVTLETETYLKGQLGEIVQFRVPGGTLGRYRNIVMGAPQFTVGQHVVVFLGVNGPRLPFILGLNQGVYKIAASAAGEPVVLPPPVMPGVVGPIVRGVAARQPAPLADFERQVRALAGGGR